MVRILSRYDYDALSSCGVTFTQKSLTQQHFKDDCDVNLILDRFMRTGEVPTSSSIPSFQDVSEFADFRDLQDAMSDARDYFESLPARVRARYNNDLTTFYESLTTRQGYDNFVSLVGATAHTAPGVAGGVGGVSEAEAERTQFEDPLLDVNVRSDTTTTKKEKE